MHGNCHRTRLKHAHPSILLSFPRRPRPGPAKPSSIFSERLTTRALRLLPSASACQPHCRLAYWRERLQLHLASSLIHSERWLLAQIGLTSAGRETASFGLVVRCSMGCTSCRRLSRRLGAAAKKAPDLSAPWRRWGLGRMVAQSTTTKRENRSHNCVHQPTRSRSGPPCSSWLTKAVALLATMGPCLVDIGHFGYYRI